MNGADSSPNEVPRVCETVETWRHLSKGSFASSNAGRGDLLKLSRLLVGQSFRGHRLDLRYGGWDPSTPET